MKVGKYGNIILLILLILSFLAGGIKGAIMFIVLVGFAALMLYIIESIKKANQKKKK